MPLTTRRSGRGGRPRLPGVHVGVGSRGYKSSHCASVTSVSYGQVALIVYTPTVIVWVGRSVTTWVPLSQDAGGTSVRILKRPLTRHTQIGAEFFFQGLFDDVLHRGDNRVLHLEAEVALDIAWEALTIDNLQVVIQVVS